MKYLFFLFCATITLMSCTDVLNNNLSGSEFNAFDTSTFNWKNPRKTYKFSTLGKGITYSLNVDTKSNEQWIPDDFGMQIMPILFYNKLSAEEREKMLAFKIQFKTDSSITFSKTELLKHYDFYVRLNAELQQLFSGHLRTFSKNMILEPCEIDLKLETTLKPYLKKAGKIKKFEPVGLALFQNKSKGVISDFYYYVETEKGCFYVEWEIARRPNNVDIYLLGYTLHNFHEKSKTKN